MSLSYNFINTLPPTLAHLQKLRCLQLYNSEQLACIALKGNDQKKDTLEVITVKARKSYRLAKVPSITWAWNELLGHFQC